MFGLSVPVRVGKTKNENEVWSPQVSLSRGTLVCTMTLYRILGVGMRKGLVRGLEFFVIFHKPLSITTEYVVAW